MGISPELVRKVLANVVDFDMHNLFEPQPFVEKLEEAAKGTYETTPESTFQHELHGGRPLMLQPDYGPNFIDRYLRVNPEGGTMVEKIIRKFQKQAADPNNLWDFSMPSEWHKHQEQPVPRVILDDFAEFNRPTEHFPGEGGGGMDTIRDWYNRGWDPADAPEMSEDLLERRMKPPDFHCPGLKRNPRTFKAGVDPSSVVASFLMATHPLVIEIERVDGQPMTREAKLLEDLSKPELYNKGRGPDLRLKHKPGETRGRKKKRAEPPHGIYHPINTSGVTFRLKRADPKNARWVFDTSSGRDHYTTVFQFKPEGNVRELSKLHVLVSCDCNSWVFWGAQYNAFRNRYLYGPIKLKKGPFGPPRRRDPQNRFHVCKHVVACIDTVLGYILPPLSSAIRKRLQRDEKTRVELPETGFGEHEPERGRIRIHMPPEIQRQERQPEIKSAVVRWKGWPPEKREEFINGLTDPDAVAFFAYRYPDTATAFVADKLREIAESKEDHKVSKRADDLLKDIV